MTRRKKKVNKQSIWKYLSIIIAGVVLLRFLLLPYSATNTKPLSISVPHSCSTDTCVTVDTSSTIVTIPSRFLGFSFEMRSLCNIAANWDTPSFEQLIKNLGPQMIRIGGNSADYSTWKSTGSSRCATSDTTITPSLVDAFFTIAYRLNTKVLWTLNLASNNPVTSGEEAGYVIKKGAELGKDNGTFLAVLGIGNEPDLYHKTGIRSSTYSLENYIKQWNEYMNRIRQYHPTAPLMGGDIDIKDTWFTSLLADKKNSISLATHHFYAIHQNNQTQGETIPELIQTLLSSSLMQQTAATIDSWRQETKGIPLAIDETNSVTGGGLKGVSDTFASTLWGIDYMFTALEQGVKFMNFHTTGGTYSPLVKDAQGHWTAKPLYYAMLAFHYAAASGTVVKTQVTSHFNIVAHSVLHKNVLYVVVINKDQDNRATVQFNLDRKFTTEHLMYLTAPSVTAHEGIVFGGQAVDPDGKWQGTAKTIPVNHPITLPDASAAVVTFE